ncbi:hypothetical protein AXW83_23840 [Bosea sp. PAMC 26642]|nr:hypothetical protein AXW83_23840 [Bosea sp. PAMC 26642]
MLGRLPAASSGYAAYILEYRLAIIVELLSQDGVSIKSSNKRFFVTFGRQQLQFSWNAFRKRLI